MKMKGSKEQASSVCMHVSVFICAVTFLLFLYSRFHWRGACRMLDKTIFDDDIIHDMPSTLHETKFMFRSSEFTSEDVGLGLGSCDDMRQLFNFLLELME